MTLWGRLLVWRDRHSAVRQELAELRVRLRLLEIRATHHEIVTGTVLHSTGGSIEPARRALRLVQGGEA